ncbi:hypothetical protein ACWCRD_26770 [Streptomyces sp. NPDC002092]
MNARAGDHSDVAGDLPCSAAAVQRMQLRDTALARAEDVHGSVQRRGGEIGDGVGMRTILVEESEGLVAADY